MNTLASLVSVHLAGEDQKSSCDELTLDTLPGKFTLTRTDAALTAYGGLVAWSSFLKHLGIIERCAERCPVLRTSPNAAPVREVLHSFSLSALVEGKRFCHVRWLTDDPAIATIMNMDRVRGEDALPRLAKEMSLEPMREWMQGPQSELYAALPERFIADWDSTVNTRYGQQEDAAVGYNPHKRGRKSHHPLICVAAPVPASTTSSAASTPLDSTPSDPSAAWAITCRRLFPEAFRARCRFTMASSSPASSHSGNADTCGRWSSTDLATEAVDCHAGSAWRVKFR